MKNKHVTKSGLYAMFSNSGITLVALIVTVVVLLILASVATYSGIEAIENSKYTKFKSELKIMQTYINNWYEECKGADETKTFKENITAKFANIAGKNVSAPLATSDTQAQATLTAIGITTQDAQANYYVLKDAQKEALGIEKEGVTQDVLISIVDRKVVSYLGMKYKNQMYYTLEDLGEFYNVDYDSTILNNNDDTKPTITVNGKSVYYGETAKGAKYRFTFNITQGPDYVDKGTVYYSKLNSNNQTLGWNSTTDTELLVEREGKYRFYYKDAAGNVSDSVDYVVEPKAELIYGQNFNIKMKELSGDSTPAIDKDNTSITNFEFATEKPDESKLKNTNIVSTNTSINPVYMWFENGTIYLWSEENWIYINESAGSMFRLCKALEKIELKVFDTRNTKNMWTMFHGCSSLKNIDVSNFNTKNVTSMNSMFNGCSNLDELNVKNFNTSSVTDNMNYMFCNCSKITKLDVSNFNTSNVISMQALFYGCSSLSNLDLSNFDTKNVINMKSMFYNCNKLTNIDLSSFDTHNVTTMNQMFHSCKVLTNLDLVGFNTSKVTDMSYMFLDCDTITDLNLRNFNTTNVNNMSCMFYSCNNLKNIDLSSFDTRNVTSFSSMFFNSPKIEELDLSSFITSKVEKMDSMFCGCGNLSKLNISYFDTSNVTKMNSMFFGCQNLEELDLSSFDTSKVTSMYHMFYSCTKVKKIYASNNFKITALSNAQIEGQDEGITTASLLFTYCNNLVGGNGTPYSSSHVDADYAHIDGVGGPGYFTRKT